ncbi:MAG: D-mannonate dehydratase ManD [Rhodospirillales bacterium]|jgi:mannonate dehydratase
MKITNARVIVSCPGRNFVTLKIETDEGLYGIGDATLNGRELAVVSYLEDHVVPCLIGRDAHQVEDIWQYLYRGAYWRRGPVTMAAIAAVDTALWDIKAKTANMPLYQLLGGRSRDSVMVYGHANGSDIAETVDEVAKYIDLGYKAIRAQSGIPGLDSTYGVAKEKMYYEPADADLPSENVWSTDKYLNHVPQLFETLREKFGEDIRLLHDVHHRLTPIEAGRLGKSLEPYKLFWMEDPTPAENQEAFRLIRQHTTTPIAVGEIFNSIFDCHTLIQEQLIDFIRTTVVHAGGITQLRRIADLAALYQIRTGCHGATDLSPVCLGTALHFDTWVPNFGVQEYMRHTEETDAVFPHAYSFKDGYLYAGETPGHGVDIDEELAAKYPYQRAYLPVNRLEDGTMWNW